MNFQLLLCFIMSTIAPIVGIQHTVLISKCNRQIPQVAKGSRMLLIGDSLAQGMSPHFNKSARSRGYLPFVKCLQGSRIDYWSPRLEAIINDIRPTLVVVSLGTNDAGMTVPESQRQHIKNIKKIIDRYGAKIIWLLPQPLPSRFVGQNDIKKIINEELQNNVYDAKIKLEKAEDKIHLTSKGYETWMNATWEHMASKGIIVN